MWKSLYHPFKYAWKVFCVMLFYSKLPNKFFLVLKMYFGHHSVSCLLFRSCVSWSHAWCWKLSTSMGWLPMSDRISIVGDIPSKPSGGGSGQLTPGGLAGVAGMLDQMIFRGPFYYCGHTQLVFRAKSQYQTPTKIVGQCFYGNICIGKFFLRGRREREERRAMGYTGG